METTVYGAENHPPSLADTEHISDTTVADCLSDSSGSRAVQDAPEPLSLDPNSDAVASSVTDGSEGWKSADMSNQTLSPEESSVHAAAPLYNPPAKGRPLVLVNNAKLKGDPCSVAWDGSSILFLDSQRISSGQAPRILASLRTAQIYMVHKYSLDNTLPDPATDFPLDAVPTSHTSPGIAAGVASALSSIDDKSRSKSQGGDSDRSVDAKKRKPATPAKLEVHYYFSKKLDTHEQNDSYRMKYGAIKMQLPSELVASRLGTFLQVVSGLLNPAGKRRRILIFVNPHSGRKLASKILQREVLPVLRSAPSIDIEVLETLRPMHAWEYCQNLLPESCFDIIASCSGDGLLHEIVNGLCLNPRTRELFERCSVVPIPGGTSNALAACLHIFKPMDAAVTILRGVPQAVDLLEFRSRSSHPSDGNLHHQAQNEDRRNLSTDGGAASVPPPRYGFLMASVGFISDCDLGTEDLRWMGGLRNTVGALKFIRLKKRVPVRVRYIPATVGAAEEVDCGEQCYFMLVVCNLPYIADNTLMSPYSKLRSETMQLLMVEDMSRAELLKLFGVIEKGNHLPHPRCQSVEVKQVSIELNPASFDSYVDFDGELMPKETFTVAVSPDRSLPSLVLMPMAKL